MRMPSSGAPADRSAADADIEREVDELIGRARAAQAVADGYDQSRINDVIAAAAWAILEPSRNRALAERAVADTGIGTVEDKIRKNYRKTLGLLRDLQATRTVGIIAEDEARGIVEIARPVGVVCAVTPSTNPAATPANKIINSLAARNAVVVAPSPKGWSTCAMLLGYVHEQLDRIGAPRDLVQMLPAPVSKQSSAELMRPLRPGRRHRLASQREGGLSQRHAGIRRGRRQRCGHRRRNRRRRRRCPQDRKLQDLRQRQPVARPRTASSSSMRSSTGPWLHCASKAACC
jgi:hypothetical protein